MKKILIMGALVLATVCSVQAQTANTTPSNNPNTDGTTKNSGVGNASNGSSSSSGATNSSGAVGADNGTSYGMQSTTPGSRSATGSGSSRRKAAKAKPNKPN